MATDTGLVDTGKDVLSIVGTERGGYGFANTLCNSNDLFEARIKEVVAKPARTENMEFWGVEEALI